MVTFQGLKVSCKPIALDLPEAGLIRFDDDLGTIPDQDFQLELVNRPCGDLCPRNLCNILLWQGGRVLLELRTGQISLAIQPSIAEFTQDAGCTKFRRVQKVQGEVMQPVLEATLAASSRSCLQVKDLAKESN